MPVPSWHQSNRCAAIFSSKETPLGIRISLTLRKISFLPRNIPQRGSNMPPSANSSTQRISFMVIVHVYFSISEIHTDLYRNRPLARQALLSHYQINFLYKKCSFFSSLLHSSSPPHPREIGLSPILSFLFFLCCKCFHH